MTDGPDAPLFHQKLIGFRGWSWVAIPPGAPRNAEARRLAADLATMHAHAAELRERIEDLHAQVAAKDSVIASLVMKSEGAYVPARTHRGVSTPDYDALSGYSALSTAGLVGGSLGHLHMPPPPVEQTPPRPSPDPGLWTGQHTYWHPGRPTRAVCHAWEYAGMGLGHGRSGPADASGHVAPDPTCTCGLHATYDHVDARHYAGVIGAVTAWGRIEAHKTVFRAEYMEPALFGVDPSAPPAQQSALSALAEMYGVEVVPIFDLAQRALEFGEPIPEEYRGRPKPPPMDPRVPLEDLRSLCMCTLTAPGSEVFAANCPVHRC